ncbi:hypothetical protein AAVH_24862, partial [Aphelenchoides avenae]
AAVLGLCPPGYRVHDNQCCSVEERRRRGLSYKSANGVEECPPTMTPIGGYCCVKN